MDRDGYLYRRPAFILAAIPFLKDLPNPHTVRHVLATGSAAHDLVDHLTYKSDSAPYFSVRPLPIGQQVDASMCYLGQLTDPA